MFVYIVAVFIHNPDGAVAGRLEGGRVRSILLCLFCHKTDVWHRSHCGRVERSVFDTVFDGRLIKRCVAMIGNDKFCIALFAVRAPHLAGCPDGGRHGGIDDNITRYMQVCYTFIGIDHRDGGTFFINRFDIGLDLRLFFRRQTFYFCIKIAKSVSDINLEFFDKIGMFVKNILIENLDRMPENYRVGDLHHRGFHMKRKKNTFCFCIFDLFFKKSGQAVFAHERGINHLTSKERHVIFKNGDVTLAIDKLYFRFGRLFECDRFFVGKKIAAGHGGNMRFGIRFPFTHRMRMFAGITFHRARCAPIRISFTQNRIDRRS